MKKSKWILNLTLSIVTVMLAAEVLAKGGKNPSVRAGNGGVMHGSTVYGFNPSMRAAMRYQITLDRMRGTPNMSRNEFRKQKRQNRKQCISSCLQSFGKYYDVASSLSPWGLVGGTTFIITDVLGDYSEDSLRRRGNTNLWSGSRGRGTWLIRGANAVRYFNGVSLIGGGIGFLGQKGIETYCKRSECKKA